MLRRVNYWKGRFNDIIERYSLRSQAGTIVCGAGVESVIGLAAAFALST